MRHATSRLSALLLCGLLPAGGAAAQGQPGWVDPPARSSRPQSSPTPPPAAAQTPPDQAAPTPAASGGPDPAETAPVRRTAERHPSSRRALRRPSRTAAAPDAMPAAMPPVPEERVSEWASAAEGLTRAYFDSVSAPGNAMVAAAPRFYGPRVRFHGRVMTLAALIAEKRRFVQRWPERRYEPRPDSIRTACSPAAALCRVDALFDFRAENPARGLRSQGVSSVTFEVSFAGSRPVIVSETSQVLRRDGPVSGLAASRRPV